MLTAGRNELLTRVGRGTPVSDNGIVKTRRVLLKAASAVSMVVPRELSLPDAVAMAQEEPAKTVPAA